MQNNTDVTNQTFVMPSYFDARLKWGKMCPSISEVHNQGRCRSGWVSIYKK